MVLDPKIQLQAQAELELRRRRQERPADFTPEFVSDPTPGAARRPFEPSVIPQVLPRPLTQIAGEAFEDIGFRPIRDEEATGFRGRERQLFQNLLTGGVRGAVEFPLSIIDALTQSIEQRSIDPALQAGRQFAEFIPSQVETVGTALGAQRVDPTGRITGINPRTGLAVREPITPTEEEVSQAQRQLREQPEGPVFAALLGRGAVGGVRRLTRPREAPVRAPEAAPVAPARTTTQTVEPQPPSPKIQQAPAPTGPLPVLATKEIKPVLKKVELLPKEPAPVKAPKPVTRETLLRRLKIKQPFEMTRKELLSEFEKAKTRDATLDKDILGEDLQRYNAAQRRANSFDPDVAKRGQIVVDEIEGKLTPGELDRLHGIGQKELSAEELKPFVDELNDLDPTSAVDLGRSISTAITDVGLKTDPAKMGFNEQVAFTKIRAAIETASERGFSPETMLKAALEGARRRFGADAELMLERFIKPSKAPSVATAPKTPQKAPVATVEKVPEIVEVQPDVPKAVATSRKSAEATPVAGKPLRPTRASTAVDKAEVALSPETVKPRDISSAISDMRTFQDKISVSKTGFDQAIQKKLTQRGKEINRDKSLSPKLKRLKRQSLKNLITKVEAEGRDIATRRTKAGNIRGSIRRSGIFVPGEFARYEGFKDIKGRLSKDPTVAIQEMDGALSVEAKAKLPGQEGPAEQFILRRTQDMTILRNRFNADNTTRLKTISSGLSTKQRKSAFQILEKISKKDATLDPTELVKRSSISKTTTDPKVIKFTQEARKVFDDLFDLQNEFRRQRNQSEIKRRAFYSPDILRDITIWDKAQFWNKSPREIIAKPELPDFIKPNQPFNPRELAKKGLLEQFEKVDDLGTLLENYSNTASRDIFNTSIIQNGKAFAEQLRSMGFEGNARFIEDWMAEAFAGVKAGVDRAFHVGNKTSKMMNRFRSALNRSVFPLNFSWNITVQTSSAALATTRYGFKNSLNGVFDWFGDKAFRREIETKAYSAIIKRDKGSRITQQDAGVGSTGRIKFRDGKLDSIIDAANFFTEWTERHLTGWSVATAKRHGESIGLKDRALWDYASDGGAKTQSMYNFEDAPAILRNQLVKTAAPFNTFSFTMWNTMKEFAGKTGTPPATFKKRAGWALRFFAGVSAINYIGSQTTGREPWDLRGFVPFYSLVFGPIEAKITDDRSVFAQTRQLPSPIGIGAQLADGLEELITKGKWDKLRQWLIKFGSGWLGIPAGTQMNRTVEGLIAISEGGDFDAAGRMKYPITEIDDKLIAIVMGKYATPGGQAYLDKRANERKRLADSFLKPNPLNIILDEDVDRTDKAPLRQVKPRKAPKPRRK